MRNQTDEKNERPSRSRYHAEPQTSVEVHHIFLVLQRLIPLYKMTSYKARKYTYTYMYVCIFVYVYIYREREREREREKEREIEVPDMLHIPPKTRGTIFQGPYNKDPTVLAIIFGSPIFGNSQIITNTILGVHCCNYSIMGPNLYYHQFRVYRLGLRVQG